MEFSDRMVGGAVKWRTAGRFEDDEEQRRYSFGAAVREVKKAYFCQVLGGLASPITDLFEEKLDVVVIEDDERELSVEILEALAEIFIAARVQQNGRAIEAAWRDVIICAMIYAGHNKKSIGFALGIGEGNVRKYRQKIRAVLKKKVDEQ